MLVSPHLNWTQGHQYHPDLMWSMKPHLENVTQSYPFGGRTISWTFSTNAQGLRQPPLAAKGEQYRVLVLGDSRTYGLGVNDNETWPVRLHAFLEEEDPGAFEVVNAGVTGYSALQGLRYLEHSGLALEPDVVLVCFGYNEGAPIPPPGIGDGDWRNPSASSGFVALLTAAIQGAGLCRTNRVGERTTRLTPGEFLDTLIAIKTLCDSRKMPVVYVAWPHVAELIGEEYGHPHYTVLVSQAARLAHAPLIDLSEALMSASEPVFLDACHLNALGARIVAAHVAAELKQLRQENFGSSTLARLAPETQEDIDAAGVYRKFIRLCPACFIFYDKLDALLEKQQDLDGRVDLWRTIAAEHPDVAQPYFYLGHALKAKQDLDGAIEAYRKAVERAPIDVMMPEALARALAEKGEPRSAIDVLRAAIQRNPSLPHLRPYLVELLCDVEDYDAAQMVWDECRAMGVALPEVLIEKLNRRAADQ